MYAGVLRIGISGNVILPRNLPSFKFRWREPSQTNISNFKFQLQFSYFLLGVRVSRCFPSRECFGYGRLIISYFLTHNYYYFLLDLSLAPCPIPLLRMTHFLFIYSFLQQCYLWGRAEWSSEYNIVPAAFTVLPHACLLLVWLLATFIKVLGQILIGICWEDKQPHTMEVPMYTWANELFYSF